jgi:hypothetical protein
MRSHHWLIFIIGLAFALLAVASSASAVDIPGDLVVGDHQTFTGSTLNVNGDIIVNPGGWLDLTSVDVTMMCTADGEFTIKVLSGGELTMNGGSIKADNAMYRYKVELRGKTTLEAINVRDTWATGTAFDASGTNDPTLTSLVGGVQIYHDNVYIGNSTLENGSLCMVYASGSTPTLYGNTIKDVNYDVRFYSQTTTNPSDTKWSAIAFGVILDNAAATLDSNICTNIGTFGSMTSVYYSGTSTNNNRYDVVAAAVGVRTTHLDIESSTITNIGVLNTPNDSFLDNGNTVNQRFYQYRVAGMYAFRATGCDLRFNDIQSSTYGTYFVVDPSPTGGPMTFDIIIDNTMSNNAKGGILFDLDGVQRDATINVSDNDIDSNGEGTTLGLEDSGFVVTALDCTGDITVIMQQNNLRNNHARGGYLDYHSQIGAINIAVTGSNTFSGNRGAGLLINMDTVSGDVDILVTNTTFSSNTPNIFGDSGALAIEGGSLTAGLQVKLSDVAASANSGTGVGIDMGGVMAVNLATNTKYTVHNCNFGQNTQGLYIFDSYGANAQNSEYDLRGIRASNNDQAVYIHSNSQLGNIRFGLRDLTAEDSSNIQTAVRIQLAAATFNPMAKLRNLRITQTGAAGSSVGLALQGVDENKRWKLELLDSYIALPFTSLDATYCEVTARRCNLTGTGVNSIIARDSNVHLYDCRLPDLSAQTMGTSIDIGVYYYQWFNISRVSWQNLEPIRNQTITIRRFRDPQDEVYTQRTDGNGLLPFDLVPFWVKDENNNPLRNDELQAFATIRGDTINSLPFDFNVTAIGIEDPNVPELFINTPGEGTVQKSGTLIIQGEIRDGHSGIKAVEVTLDNVIWYNATALARRVGQNRATFELPIFNLTDSVYTITVRGWDVARWDNESRGVALLTIKNVRIDTEPPFLQILSPAEPFWVTKQRFFDIVGQTERSINIKKLTINDMPLPVFGSTFSYNASLIEGTNTYVIIAEDTAGNIAVATRQIVLDTLAPPLIVTTPTDYFSSREQDFEVSGDTEQLAHVYVQLDDRQPQEVFDRGGTRFYFIQPIKQEGFHTITVYSEDIAGNTQEEVIWVKYDITPPVLEDIVPSHDPKPTNNQRVYVSGMTDTEVEQVSVNNLIFDVHNGAFTLEINLLEGQQELTIEVTDAAGNHNFTTRSILIDVSPPFLTQLTVASVKAGGKVWNMEDGLVINERSVRFRGALLEHDAREVWIQVGSDNRTAIEEDPDTTYFYRDFNLDEGENIVSIFAFDQAGNKLIIHYHLIVDPRPPTIKYFNPKMTAAMEARSSEDTILVSGVLEESGVTLMINNRQVAVRPDTGAFQTNVPLVEGMNNIEIVATDRAGNIATDVIAIDYQPGGDSDDDLGSRLASFWWVFAIVIALAIIIPLTVHNTRNQWVSDHPELEEYDRSRDREGMYDYDGYEDEYDYQDYQEPGGGY